MRLEVDFDGLEVVASRFRSQRTFQIQKNDEEPLERIDIELSRGIEIQLSDLDSVDGLLSYKGRHVILYIRDHGSRLDDAIKDPDCGKKFHVAECETLDSMRSQGRFERYVVTQSTTGEFEISGRSQSGQLGTGVAELKVCKNCLKKLNYNSYALAPYSERTQRRDAFSLLAFFETYSTRFKELPRGLASKEAASGYGPRWKETSLQLREKAGYQCAECRACLREHKDLLHVHHINGVKNDDRPDNLKVLCKDCHRKQPMHGHIFVARREMAIIARLRSAQGLRPKTWDDAMRLADLAMRPTLELARHQRWDVPELAVDLPRPGKAPIHLDAAWPKSRRGIVSEPDPDLPTGWRAETAGGLLSELVAAV